MNNSTQILDKINAALAAMPYPDQPVGLYEPIKYVLSLGGKRLRPVLLLLAYQLYRDDLDCAMPAALGLETYHNYTLLHDDLMDRADIRRGRPTVHRVWDENTAILSGDTMLVLAYRLMQACENADVLRLFTKTALEIGEGQQYDMNFERRTDVTEPEYIEMIRLKTSVLLACAAKAGAILGGASDEDADLLYAYAEQVGLAFQLQDDWLDVYGDPAVFGKKIGGDILCDKKTYLLINAWMLADNAQRERLNQWIGHVPEHPEEKVEAVTAIYDELGISSLCLDAIEHYFAKAQELLEQLHVPAERNAELQAYVGSLLNRKS